MSPARLGDQGLLQGPGRHEGRVERAEIKKAYRKLARANHPDSNPGDTAKPRSGSRSISEAYAVVATPRSARSTTRSALSLGGFGAASGGSAAGRAAVASTSTTSAARPAPAAAAGSATCSVACSAAGGPARAAPPARGARRRDRRDDQLRPRHRRPDGLAAAEQSDEACPACSGTGAQARHHAARLSRRARAPACASPVGRRVRDDRALPGDCRGRDWCTTTRARSATAPAAARRPARSRPGSPPASRTARRSGCGARALRRGRRPDRRPLRRRAGRRRTRSSVARATTSPSTCRCRFDEPRSAPRSRCRPSAARRSR